MSLDRPANIRTRINKDGYQISLQDLSKKQLKEIKETLTVKPELIIEYAKPKKFPLFQLDNHAITVPRKWGFENFGNASYNGRTGTPATRLQLVDGFKLDPSRRQPDAFNAVISHFESADFAGGLLVLPCGFGKTVLAAAIMSRMGVKTAVVVHKTFLMTQWEERISFFLPNAKVGKIQGPKVDIEGCDIVLCMLQSIAMKEYDSSVFDSFAMLIVDECHIVNTIIYSKALQKMHTKYMLGLTATLRRKDKLEKVIGWYMGDVLFEAQRDNLLANVELIYTDVSEVEILHNNKTKKIDAVGMITAFTQDKKRNQLLVNLTVREYKKGAKILILSERREHLETLQTMLADIQITDCGLYMGGLPEAQLQETERCQIILGTYSMASTGLDIQGLSSLIFATPRSDVVQSSGRILRNKTELDKLIIDVVDRVSIFIGQMRRRIKGYYDQSFKILGATDDSNAEEPRSCLIDDDTE